MVEQKDIFNKVYDEHCKYCKHLNLCIRNRETCLKFETALKDEMNKGGATK